MVNKLAFNILDNNNDMILTYYKRETLEVLRYLSLVGIVELSPTCIFLYISEICTIYLNYLFIVSIFISAFTLGQP